MIVVDASIVIAVVMNEPERARIIQVTTGKDTISPSSLPFEIANALTSLVKRRSLSPADSIVAWKAANDFAISLRDIDLGAALKIAVAHNIYAYDAFMLQCCLETSGNLITLDKKLKAIGTQLGITSDL